MEDSTREWVRFVLGGGKPETPLTFLDLEAMGYTPPQPPKEIKKLPLSPPPEPK